MISYHVSEENLAALIDVVRQSVSKSQEGSIWKLVRELFLKFLKNCGCDTSADVVLVDVSITADLVARSQGRSEHPKSNAPKKLQHVEAFLLGFWCPPLDACGDGAGIVHAITDPR